MMLLVQEYFTGGGLWSQSMSQVAAHPLVQEGQCMVEALTADLAQVDQLELVQLVDARLVETVTAAGRVVPVTGVADQRRQLATWSARADATLLIAPESGGCLLDRCQLVQQSGGRLLSPDPEFVALTTNKQATAEHLTRAGVPTPVGTELERWTSDTAQVLFAATTTPLVVKPRDGAGSLNTFLLQRVEDWQAWSAQLLAPTAGPWRIEPYHCGTPASVAALCGPRGAQLLPPCRQRLSTDGCLTYLGGSYPLDPELSRRACALARTTLAALPHTTGYVGIDMILADAPRAAPDVVVEVNPRLTTSYVGLRRAASSNLARAMLAIAAGQSHPLFFRPEPVQFTASAVAEAPSASSPSRSG